MSTQCVAVVVLPVHSLVAVFLPLLILLAVPMLGHVGDGNVHSVFLIDPSCEQAYKQTEHFSAAIAE